MMWKVTLAQTHKVNLDGGSYEVNDNTVFYFEEIASSLIQLTRIVESHSGRKTTIEIHSLSDKEYEAEVGDCEEE